MLKYFRRTMIAGALIFLCGCTTVRNAVYQAQMNFFAPYTVTVPVLVTERPTETSSPVPTLTPTATVRPTGTPTATPKVTVYPTATFESIDLSSLPVSAEEGFEMIQDVTFPDGSLLQPGELFVKAFRIKNTGKNAWEYGTKVSVLSSKKITTPSLVQAVFLRPQDLIELSVGSWGMRTYNVAVGDTVDLAVILQAPEEPGDCQIDFQLILPNGEKIHTPLWMRFTVAGELPKPGVTPTASPTPQRAVYDWNGIWMISDPDQSGRDIHPLTAWIKEDGDQLKGFFYDAQGEPQLVHGSISDGGRVFSGIYNYPWQPDPYKIRLRMNENRKSFSALSEDGKMKTGMFCGCRGNSKFPSLCAVISSDLQEKSVTIEKIEGESE